MALSLTETIREIIAGVLSEANPWHDEDGEFTDEKNALVYSLGGTKKWYTQKPGGKRVARPIKAAFGRASGLRGAAHREYMAGAFDGYWKAKMAKSHARLAGGGND